MANDWIKMRLALQSHPKVVRILSAIGSDKFAVVGGLHAVWGVFDTHSADGVLSGYTAKALDHVIGWEGFSQAMIEVGWLIEDDAQTLSLPEFDEHNGASGKRRAEDQKRKRKVRNSPQSVRNLSAKDEDEKWTREEKRREDIKPKSKALVRATRLPKNWEPDAEQIDFIKSERPDLSVEVVAAQFRDYWVAKSGSGGTKLDWSATWRNWVRNQRGGAKQNGSTFYDERKSFLEELTGRNKGGNFDPNIIDL